MVTHVLTHVLWLLAILVAVVNTARDSQGKEFILAYMENKQSKHDPLNDIEVSITTTSNTPAEVTVSTPRFNASWTRSITVSRGNIETVKVPHTIRGVDIEKSNKGVYIVATQEVSVFSVNKEPKSTDAYTSLPLDVLGTEYYALTYTGQAEVVVAATQDDTVVSIKWPDSDSIDVHYDGVTYRKGETLTVTLNKFETFHVRQSGAQSDFTGAYITSNKPISVISGNRKIAVPVGENSQDHLTEMLMPVDTWGKEFISTSTPDRSIGDVFRVVASEDNTKVTFNREGTKTIIKAGDFKDVDIDTGKYQSITSDKPVMIAMFAKTFKNDGPNFGDPSMCMVIPVLQYASDYTWTSVQDPTGADFSNNVAVIIAKSQVSGLRMDGNTVNWEDQKDAEGSSKTHLWVHVAPGTHNLYHNDPAVTFMALVSGTYKLNSYAYPAGMRLAQINVPCEPSDTVAGDIVDNDCDGTIDEETLNDLDDDGDGLVDEDLAMPPRIDGVWGSWGAYGACSVCNGGSGGTKTRTRTCDSPAPANNGLGCPDSGVETVPCTSAGCRECRLRGDPHFRGFRREMRGDAPFPCMFRMVKTGRFQIGTNTSAEVEVLSKSALKTTGGRYYIDCATVLISIFDTADDSVTPLSYQVCVIDIQNALKEEPMGRAWGLPADHDAYASTISVNTDPSTGTASLYVQNDSGTDTQVEVHLTTHVAGSKQRCLKVKISEEAQPPNPEALFPHTLCSTWSDTSWGMASEEADMSNCTSQQVILYGLLSQAVDQTEAVCFDALEAANMCNTNQDLTDGVVLCDRFLMKDQVKCLENGDEGTTGDALRAFNGCLRAKCTGVTTPDYQTLLDRQCE